MAAATAALLARLPALGLAAVLLLVCHLASVRCEDCAAGGCDDDTPCGAGGSEEDRRLFASGDPLALAARHVGFPRSPSATGARRAAGRRLQAPPEKITIASLALPKSGGFLDEAALMETVIAEINADSELFPNTNVKGLVVSEGTDI